MFLFNPGVALCFESTTIDLKYAFRGNCCVIECVNDTDVTLFPIMSSFTDSRGKSVNFKMKKEFTCYEQGCRALTALVDLRNKNQYDLGAEYLCKLSGELFFKVYKTGEEFGKRVDIGNLNLEDFRDLEKIRPFLKTVHYDELVHEGKRYYNELVFDISNSSRNGSFLIPFLIYDKSEVTLFAAAIEMSMLPENNPQTIKKHSHDGQKYVISPSLEYQSFSLPIVTNFYIQSFHRSSPTKFQVTKKFSIGVGDKIPSLEEINVEEWFQTRRQIPIIRKDSFFKKFPSVKPVQSVAVESTEPKEGEVIKGEPKEGEVIKGEVIEDKATTTTEQSSTPTFLPKKESVVKKYLGYIIVLSLLFTSIIGVGIAMIVMYLKRP